MRQENPRRAAGIAAAAIVLAATAVQIGRTVLAPPEGIVCVLRRRSFALIPVAGTFAFLPHFVIGRAAGGLLEIGYLLALPLTAVLVWFTFKGEPRLGSRSKPAPRRRAGPMSI